MSVAEEEDVFLLANEKLDFDLSLSSSSANEDEEFFFGPVGHKERRIAAHLELNDRLHEPPCGPASVSPRTWSPLTGEKFVEVYKEAHLLALQIESHSRREAAKSENSQTQGMERFVQESQLKVNLFEKEEKMEKSPRSLKRETYFLSDSPLMGPPLSGVQPPSAEPLIPAFSSALPSAPAPAPASPAPAQALPPSVHPLPGEPSSARPPIQAVSSKRITSKLQPPRASAMRGQHLQLAEEKPKNEVPGSPSRMKLLSEKEPHRDVLSDRPCTALDAASLPASGSQLGQGKRLLPIPSKLGLKKVKKTLLKPPAYPGHRTRKPSCSGSASSLTSSVCASPAAGRAKPSELAGFPASSSQPLSSTGKSSRMGPTTLRQPPSTAPTGTSCRPAGRANAAQPTVEQPKASAAAPPTQPHTPESGGSRPDSASSQLSKTRSIRRRESCLNSKTRAVSTPTNLFKIPKFSLGGSPDSATPKLSQAQRLQSLAPVGRVAVHSTPVRRSSGLSSQSLSGSTRTPTSARRASALPTPAGWRLSGLPLMTPQSTPRTLASPLCAPPWRLSSEPQKNSTMRPVLTQESDRSAGCGLLGLGLSPDGSPSPPASVPQALCFSPEQSAFPLSEPTAAGAAQDEATPRAEARPGTALLIDIGLDQLTITSAAEGRAPADRPLIDLGSTPEARVPLGPEARPLIDLTTNTPEADRKGAPKPLQAERELIDLGFPLIQLSPEADKENVDSPLLRF